MSEINRIEYKEKLTKDLLIAKLADLEWEDFEVIAAKDGSPKDTWKTISAFTIPPGDGYCLALNKTENNLKYKDSAILRKLKRIF